MYKGFHFIFLCSSIIFVGLSACVKNGTEAKPNPPAPFKLAYKDSIIYLKDDILDNYIVEPLKSPVGIYTGFPDGIEIDSATGKINVSESETGLRYRITYTSPKGETSSTTIVLSGMNFKDKFYRLSQGDSLAFPIYNASVARVLPVSGSNFDEGKVANASGCAIKTTNGQINLPATVRNGVFGKDPKNDVRKDFDIFYRLNDKSSKSLNRLRVRLYYYKSMADVAPDLLQTLKDRENLGVFLESNTNSSTVSVARTNREARPRPPCIILIAN